MRILQRSFIQPSTVIKDSAISVATLNMRSFSVGKKKRVKALAIFELQYDTLVLRDPQMGYSGLEVLKNNWKQERKNIILGALNQINVASLF